MIRQSDQLKLWNLCQRAASQLDEIEKFWYHQVNPNTLEMKHCDSCIAGKIFGDGGRFGASSQYDSIVSRGLNPVAFGYDYSQQLHFEGIDDYSNTYYWDLLNDYWRKLIRRRQNND